MIGRSTLAAILAVSLPCTASAAVLLQATGGPIPVPYQPIDFTTYPSNPLNTQLITDGNAATGITLQGLNAVLQSNGAVADTGAFMLFRYKVDPNAANVTISLLAKVNYAALNNPFFLNVYKASDHSNYEILYDIPAPTPTALSVTFGKNGNTGNFAPYQNISLADIEDSNGVITFAINGGFVAQLDHPGVPILTLYEIGVADLRAAVVPLPRSAPFTLAGVILALLSTHRRAGIKKRG